MKYFTSLTETARVHESTSLFGKSIRKMFVTGLLAFAVTGCVSQDSVLNLSGTSQNLSNQTVLETPTGVVISGAENAQLSANSQEPWPNNVPQPAPREGSSLQTAALAVAEPNGTPIPAQRVIQSITNDPATGTGAGLVDPQQPAIAGTPDPSATLPAPETLEQPARSEPKPQATGLFARLFQNNDAAAKSHRGDRKRAVISGRGDDDRRIALAHAGNDNDISNIKTSSIRAHINRSEQKALPGVKSNSQLFGILSNRSNRSSSDETGSQTQLAAVGSLGLMSPNGLRVQHEKVQVSCLKPGILRILKIVERHYGKKPIITSGYRSPKRNRRAGGVKNSMHIFCKAVDIQVEGISKWDLAKYLRTVPGRGGVGTYCRTKSVHIDTGSVRDWHHPCRRSSKRKRKA